MEFVDTLDATVFIVRSVFYTLYVGTTFWEAGEVIKVTVKMIKQLLAVACLAAAAR